MSEKNYSEKWQKRFAFFKQNGAPNSATFKPALKALPNQRARALVAINFWALFFAPIYMATHGLWKKLLSWLVISIVAGVVCAMLPEPAASLATRGIGVSLSLLAAMSVNYAYYQKEMLGTQTWNPFEGLRFF